jgi:hypothetical protein
MVEPLPRRQHAELLSAERMPDAQTSEAAVIAVGGEPLTAGLNRKRGEVRIGNQVPARAGVGAHAGEDRPVSRSGREQRCVWLGAKGLAESKGL